MQDADALHASLLTIDTHIDIPWPDGPDPFETTARRVDLPKMRAGGLRAGCFAAYVPQGPRTPEGYEAAGNRALAMLQAINAMGRTEGDITARVTATAADVRAARADGVLAVIPAVENGHGTLGELVSEPQDARATLAGLSELERLGLIRRGFAGRWERAA